MVNCYGDVVRLDNRRRVTFSDTVCQNTGHKLESTCDSDSDTDLPTIQLQLQECVDNLREGLDDPKLCDAPLLSLSRYARVGLDTLKLVRQFAKGCGWKPDTPLELFLQALTTTLIKKEAAVKKVRDQQLAAICRLSLGVDQHHKVSEGDSGWSPAYREVEKLIDRLSTPAEPEPEESELKETSQDN
jgi:hypothetical protein